MVIIKMMGGLGNQMFQYAFGRALVERGTKVKFDLSYYGSMPEGDTARAFELGQIVPDFPAAGPQDLAKYQGIVQKFLRFIDIYAGTGFSAIREERNKGFDAGFLNEDDKYLIGYWQNSRYFEGIREKLRAELVFPAGQLDNDNIALSRKIADTENSVAVHVRGGDYFSPDNFKVFGNICTAEYYERAFELFEKRYGRVKFFLFTNDAEWVAGNIDTARHDIELVDWNNGAAVWTDMYHMSKCRHNIIANSSYSWWAAWLNGNKEKIVAAPERWTNDDAFMHIIPKEWVKIDSGKGMVI